MDRMVGKALLVFFLTLLLFIAFYFFMVLAPTPEKSLNEEKSTAKRIEVKISREGFSPSEMDAEAPVILVVEAADVPHNLKFMGREWYLQVGERAEILINEPGQYEMISDSYDGTGQVHRATILVSDRSNHE